MIGHIFSISKNMRDPEEKPFWISFADIMTALMVLFLFIMSVALLAVTKTVSQEQKVKQERLHSITVFMDDISKAVLGYPDVQIDRLHNVVITGTHFNTNSSDISHSDGEGLKKLVSAILPVTQTPEAKRWLKRIVVEGYTDQRGTYLFNLNLSLQRAQKVLCVLFEMPSPDVFTLSPQQDQLVRDLFFVGGYSFNNAKKTLAESRRVDLRFEFYKFGETPSRQATTTAENFGHCAI